MAVLREGRSSARTRRIGTVAALTGLVVLVFAVSLITVANGKLNFDVYRVDLDVYRLGAHAWMHGHDLYGQLPLTSNGLDLGFTYPPISAVVMSPLAVVTARVAGILITAITLGLLMSVIALFLRTARLADMRRSWRMAALLLPVAVLLEPVRTNLAYGQINVVLMALVSFDCLVPSTWYRYRIAGRPIGWPRGALVGVAAAMKLTPIVFVLYFVARRQWRAAVTSVVSFFVVTGIGALSAPHDSVSYWSKEVFQTSRIGPLMFAGNQSLNGFLLRTRLTGNVEHDVWLAAAAVAGILGVIAIFRVARGSTDTPNRADELGGASELGTAAGFSGARGLDSAGGFRGAGSFGTAERLNRSDNRVPARRVSDNRGGGNGRPLVTLSLTAATTLLISPVSWTHHWVWCAPIMLTAVIASFRARDRRALILSGAGLLLFAVSPQWWFPATMNRELHWGLWEQLIGSAYMWAALGSLIVAALGYLPRLLISDNPTAAASAKKVRTESQQGQPAEA